MDLILKACIDDNIVIPEFITEWYVEGDEAARTITLPLIDDGVFNCIVDWGDGTPLSTIDSFNSANRIHTYANNGTYQIKIKGDCPSWSFNNTGDRLKLTKIINWGDGYNFTGFKNLTNGFYGCSNLNFLPNTPIKPFKNLLTDVNGTFRSCNALTSIPENIFVLLKNLKTNGFMRTFSDCVNLTSIPEGLFRKNKLVDSQAFYETFSGCTNLKTIPEKLFFNNTLVGFRGFQSTFQLTGIISIPEDLFRYNSVNSAGKFIYTFRDCIYLTNIPEKLFSYNTGSTNSKFYGVFRGCTSLQTIPAELFRYETAVAYRAFYEAFYGCTNLKECPNGFFKYNTSHGDDMFGYTFYGCNKLKLNPYIFYDEGQQGTRFLNKVSDFENCFYRTTFTGEQGTAPDLWNCNFGTGTLVSSGCFGGNGNSATSISNFNDIPANWK